MSLLTSLLAPGSGTKGVVGFDSATSATGTFVAITSTTYVAVDSALDLSVGRFDGVPVAAGDILLVGLSYLASNKASLMRVDATTRVGGAAVNYISTTGATGMGVQAWAAVTASLFLGVGATVPYTVQAGDIENGAVTLGLVAKVDSGQRELNRSTTTAIHFFASLIHP